MLKEKTISQKLSIIVASFALVAVAIPSFAFARGNESNQAQQRASTTNQYSIHLSGSNNKSDFERDEDKDDDRGKDGDRGSMNHKLPWLFYNGTVTAVTDTGFTFDTKEGVSMTVNTSSAKIVQIPRTVITLADVKVGDTVHITGTIIDTTITASVVYTLPANLKPTVAKGTVTAVTDNTMTVLTKDNQTISVNTDTNTQVVTQDHQPATLADVQTGAKVKLFGLWDSVLNVFNAIKIKLWS